MCRRDLPFKVVSALLCVVALAGMLVPAVADTVALEKVYVRGAAAFVITADLNDPRIKVHIGLPAKGISHSEPFMSMVRRTLPIAAVTGTYFDTRSLLPVGTIVSEGVKMHEYLIGNTVCFLEGNRVCYIDTVKGQRCEVVDAHGLVRTGPRLLRGGLCVLDPRREGFRDPGLFGRRTRMAMGTTANNKLLLVSVTTPVTFGKLAGIMRSLGALDAIALDGGTSSAMYYRGRLVRRPGRALTNLIELRHAPESTARGGSPVSDVASDQRANRLARDVWEPYFDPAPVVRANTSGHTVSGELEPAFGVGQSLPAPVTLFGPVYPEPAVLGPPELRLSKGRGAFLPIDRAQLARLKGLQHPKYLVHIATDVKVVHYLVS